MIIDGKELIISPAGFSDAMVLKETIAKALKKNGVKFDLSSIDISSIDLDNIETAKIGDIGWVLDHILTLTTDSSIRAMLFKCAERAMFDKCKVDQDFFEIPENRKYYYPIMAEVIKINILPFFGLASSVFSKFKKMTEKFLKSK